VVEKLPFNEYRSLNDSFFAHININSDKL
jgi:hypothetical protein